MQAGDGELITGQQRCWREILSPQAQDKVGDDLGGVDQQGVFEKQLIAIGELGAQGAAQQLDP